MSGVIKLKTLSEHLGLTEGTVSRALNDYPDISAKTRERVRDAARELGYKPNSNARRLAKGIAECVGFVLPASESHFSEPFLGELLDGLTDALSKRNWDLTVSVARSSDSELDIIDRLIRSGRVSGLIVMRTHTVDGRIEFLKKSGTPFVAHGRTADPDGYAWLDIDNEQAFVDAVAHLHALGHHRIAHIGGHEAFNFARLRRLGYRRGLADHGIDYRADYDVSSEMSDQAGNEAMQRLLSLDEMPTAIVCVSDMVALGAMQAIRAAGLRPGREISVIGYDGVPQGEHSDPPLTTMAQPLTRAGRRLGDMLLAVIDGADPQDNQELWRAELVRRNTDGPPP
jgi:LacI family transcriptional regulator